MSPSPLGDVMFGGGARGRLGGGGVDLHARVCGAGGRKEEEEGGQVGWRGGSYLFVLPSRRVREQIKGFSLGGGGT